VPRILSKVSQVTCKKHQLNLWACFAFFVLLWHFNGSLLFKRFFSCHYYLSFSAGWNSADDRKSAHRFLPKSWHPRVMCAYLKNHFAPTGAAHRIFCVPRHGIVPRISGFLHIPQTYMAHPICWWWWKKGMHRRERVSISGWSLRAESPEPERATGESEKSWTSPGWQLDRHIRMQIQVALNTCVGKSEKNKSVSTKELLDYTRRGFIGDAYWISLGCRQKPREGIIESGCQMNLALISVSSKYMLIPHLRNHILLLILFLKLPKAI